jgi:hypothetical protein
LSQPGRADHVQRQLGLSSQQQYTDHRRQQCGGQQETLQQAGQRALAPGRRVSAGEPQPPPGMVGPPCPLQPQGQAEQKQQQGDPRAGQIYLIGAPARSELGQGPREQPSRPIEQRHVQHSGERAWTALRGLIDSARRRPAHSSGSIVLVRPLALRLSQ